MTQAVTGAVTDFPTGWRALAAAVLARALMDARQGKAEAVAWLERDPWAETLCDHVFDGGVDIDELRRRARRLFDEARARAREAAERCRYAEEAVR